MKSHTALLITYGADPNTPSEAYIGWSFLLAAASACRAANVRLVVLTNKRSAEVLVNREELAEGDIRIVGVGLPQIFRVFERPGIGIRARIEYLLWCRAARPLVSGLASKESVVFAHHVTLGSELYKSPFSELSSATFKVLGPVGASGSAFAYLLRPRSYRSYVEFSVQIARSLSSLLAFRFLQRGWNLILTQGEAQNKLVPHRVAVQTFPNLILPSEVLAQAKRSRAERSRSGNCLQLVVVGHLVARKRVEVAVAALTRPELQGARMTIVGRATGHRVNYIAGVVDKLGLGARVSLIGRVDRARVVSVMSSADVLVHLSGREGAPGVIAEAAAAGVPVVCLKGTGAASVLDASGGPGVSVDPRAALRDPAVIGRAILTAASMRASSSDVEFDQGRISALEATLLSTAMKRVTT